MLLTALPLATMASEIADAIERSATPVISVSSLYSYSDGDPREFRALPDLEGTFFLDISASREPADGSEIVVYYRTVDDSAVAKWGDYESAPINASVTLSKANGYRARVVVASTIMEYGFYTDAEEANGDRLLTRRFLFELTGVDGDAVLYTPQSVNDRDQSELYCYLRAQNYSYQNSTAAPNVEAWPSSIKTQYYKNVEELIQALEPDLIDEYERELIYALVNDKWKEETSRIKSDSFYYAIDPASYINTPHIKYGGTHSDTINLKFSDDWHSYVESGVCDLGISINGKLTREYWDSDGDATFTLYYSYRGETKKALTLYMQGEFDDSQFFGWEHAFEYAVEGLTSRDREDHVNDNFLGFTLYDNDGNIAYEVFPNDPDDGDKSTVALCNDLKKTIIDKYAVELLASYNEKNDYNDNFSAYYLKLPSNFALADGYSYELVLEKEREKEIRWLENVQLAFALIGNKQPMIAKDQNGNQMVTTNLDSMREGDPLRMSVRFDRPVYARDPDDELFITVDIYNDKGACLAKEVKLTLKQLEDKGEEYSYYAWDTLVFEGALPDGLDGAKIASLRNIKINDDRVKIKSFFTNLEMLGKTIGNIYIDRDFRVPVATLNVSGSDIWTKSKSVDVYLSTEEGARFTDYATVYYQWSSSKDTPEIYGSKVVFHTKDDGEILKSIIGTGNGETYLHMRTVSSYGKSSISGPFGPFYFDNAPPTLTSDQITVTGTLKDRTISVPMPDDNGGSGLSDMALYYIGEDGESVRLKSFTASDFKGDPKTLTYTISHKDVGIGVDADGNVTLERGEVKFYFTVSDKLGNTSERAAEFMLVFDTNDYLDGEIAEAGVWNDMFKANTKAIDAFNFIYNYRPNANSNAGVLEGTDKAVYFAFLFRLNEGAFGEVDGGAYGARIYYKGEELEGFTVYSPDSQSYFIYFHEEIASGRYDIQLTRTEGESIRFSRVYSVYATDAETDQTEIKDRVESGTLLNNSVYQLSSETNEQYFYYKDASGAIQKIHYNDTKQPATFSSFAKAKEYVYYKELGDIYLVQLTAATASALNSGTTGYMMARGETVTPQAGQYWIRYKSESWTPTSGEAAWVYYYYGTSPTLTEGALSSNLQAALNAVANRITGYGKSVILTDTSLFLGTVMGDKMLDKNGIPYLAPGQIHDKDELAGKTMCGNVWSTQVGFAADRHIYRSEVYVGMEETEYPLVGNFELPAGAILQYMTYDQYKGGTSSWNTMNIARGDSFVGIFDSSGVYYIRELSRDGVSVFAIYVDKAAPEVSFSHTDEDGNLVEIPVDGDEIRDIRSKDLYIGSISNTECDRLSYVAVYKVSDYSLVGVYTAEELDRSVVKLEDGNYYIVVADRSGNHYTVTAKVSSTPLECSIKESADKYIRLSCNRRADQILRYEVYLNGALVTSTYSEEQTFSQAGLYTIYVQDIYGNEFSEERIFERNYPTASWKYLTEDGKYKEYNESDDGTGGFILNWISDNQYKISTSVKTRFSISGDYGFEFIGTPPEHTTSVGVDTVVTIEAGSSFTLKVYYKNHKDCYAIYSGVVDVTPPSISVSAEVDVLRNGEYSLFDEWALGELGDVIMMKDLYYVLSESVRRSVSNGDVVRSSAIEIGASDANELSLLQIYLNGELIEEQDADSGFSRVTVSKWGEYRILAKDGLGNVSEFTFTNGRPDDFDYFVDGVEREQDTHGYLNFELVDGKHVYNKVDYGNGDFRIDIKEKSDVFISVSVSGAPAEIYGFSISDGAIYPLFYRIEQDDNGNKTVNLYVGEAILDIADADFKLNREYLISADGAYPIYASIGADGVVSIRVYASEDTAKTVLVGARIEVEGGSTSFVCAELSRKSSSVSFVGSGIQTSEDVRVNSGFIIDESAFESERIASIRLYYSRLNDLDPDKLAGKTNIYTPDREYDDEGFYLLIVRNHYGNEKIYRIAISRSFGVTSSVTFSDGHELFYSKDYSGTLYSDGEITLDALDEGVTLTATRNGVAYTGFLTLRDGGITYFVFSEEGEYEVTLTDSYGNRVLKRLDINKSTYTVADDLLTGYNEKALKRDEGYTNQKLSIDKDVYDKEGIYYLAIAYGDSLKVLYDAFAENTVTVDEGALIDAIGAYGDGVYTVICRNRYGAVVTKEIHYRGTPTLKLERTIRSSTESEIYDLAYALEIGFWSNNTLKFSTDAKTYVFTVNGSVAECPRTIVFENAGDFGSFEYEITYIDEYGFEYSFTAYLVRRNVTAEIPSSVAAIEIDGVFNSKRDVIVTFGENMYAFYTRDNGEAVAYRSGEVLRKDGTYRFTVMDYAGNTTMLVIKKDTAVEFAFIEQNSGSVIQNGSVVNSSKISFDALNKDSAYIEKVILNGVLQADFVGSKFTENGKWEIIVRDKIGNRAYFCFYVVTRQQNGFAYTTPYEYRITEVWYDSGDGAKVSYMSFVAHGEYGSSFDFTENGKYTVVMTSDVTGVTSSFEFTVNTSAPEVSLVGCEDGETTISDVTVSGYKVGDRIRVYRATKTGEELVAEVEILTLATKVPTIDEGGEYRIVVESEAGVQTELSFVRKHVMNTAGSIFIMVIIGMSVVGLFTGLVYRNKSKTDD